MNHVDQAEMVALTNEANNLSEAGKTMYGIHYGEAYESDLDVVEIAKRIRSQLKQLSKAKHSPLYGAKVSVRIERYSMGRSIDARLGLPYRVDVTEEEQANTRMVAGQEIYLTPAASAAKKLGQEIVDAFNFDGSDSMTDYYHVNYSGFAHVYELEGSNK